MQPRVKLIVLQVLVAVLAIGAWHVLTATNVLPTMATASKSFRAS